jgi:hypothetical protein
MAESAGKQAEKRIQAGRTPRGRGALRLPTHTLPDDRAAGRGKTLR